MTHKLYLSRGPLAIVMGLALLATASCVSMSGKHATLMCSTCHSGSPEKGAASLKDDKDPSALCKNCHRYERPVDHHPTIPDSTALLGVFGKAAVLPPEFKLQDGKMGCLTCHRMHGGDNYYSGTESFLVGGPYEDRRDVCRKCHKKRRFPHLNPHIDQPLSIDIPQKYKCLTCHIDIPQKSDHNLDNLKLRASDSFLCLKCHPPMPGEFMEQHFLKSIDAWESSYDISVEYRSIVELSSAPQNSFDDSVLHLDPFSRITCYTCHNPHRPGLMHLQIKGKADEGVRTGVICTVCHKM